MSATITQRLADHVVGLRFEDLPPNVVATTKDLLVHHAGVALRGRRLRSGRQAVALALELTGAEGACSIVGEHSRADLLEAVYANSSLISSVGLVDGLFPPGVHPGVVVQPTAWAVGEATGASGPELLTAVVAGYDVVSKLHNGVWDWQLAIPRPLMHLVAPFGGAATAARLFGFSREEVVHALGHAGQTVVGLYEEVGGSLHALAARNGLMAAMLARAGMPASPTIIEGRYGVYPSYFLEDVPAVIHQNLEVLGKEFEIAKAQTQPYATSALNTVPVQITQRLMHAHRLTPERLNSVDVVLPVERQAREATRPNFADRGPRYLVALTALDGQLDPARFEQPPSDDVVAMAERVRLRFEPGHPLRYSRVEMTTTEGDQHRAEASHAAAATSLDWDEWIGEGGSGVLSEQQVARFVDVMRHLEDVPNIAEVTACLTPTAGTVIPNLER